MNSTFACPQGDEILTTERHDVTHASRADLPQLLAAAPRVIRARDISLAFVVNDA
jgi:hypothetical protein